MERCPGELWVINDRTRVARICLWLTCFDPQCLVAIVIGQPRSLWVTGRIPGATRWSVGWAWVNRGEGVEQRRRCGLGFQMGTITRYSKEESLSHLCSTTWGWGSLPLPPPYPSHLCLQNASLGPSLAVGGTTNLLCPKPYRSAENWPGKFWEITVHWLTRMRIHHQPTQHREAGLSLVCRQC